MKCMIKKCFVCQCRRSSKIITSHQFAEDFSAQTVNEPRILITTMHHVGNKVKDSVKGLRGLRFAECLKILLHFHINAVYSKLTSGNSLITQFSIHDDRMLSS